MKKAFLILAVFCQHTISAQVPNYDSLKSLLASANDAQTKSKYASILADSYLYTFPGTALIYVQQSIILAREIKSDSALSVGLSYMGVLSNLTGNIPQAIYYGLESLKIAERSKKNITIAVANQYLSWFYLEAGDYELALRYSLKAKNICESGSDTLFSNIRIAENVPFFMHPGFRYLSILLQLASTYQKLNKIDSAFKYAQLVNQSFYKLFGTQKWSAIPYLFGDIYSKMGDYDRAIQNYHTGIDLAVSSNIPKDVIDNSNGLAKVFRKINLPDSAVFYAMKGLEAEKFAQYQVGKLTAFEILSDVYKSKNNIDSTAKYLDRVISTKDSLFNQQKAIQMQSMTFNEQLRQQDIIEEQEAYKDRIKTYLIIGGFIIFFIVAALLYRNNIQKQRAKIKIEKAYQNLKATQSQLIQSEKMASLGELTAGIAHEIQNPLNFVNNFSEVNKELIDEASQANEAGNSAGVRELLSNLRDNEEKISQHGKRADSIVKGMLQHSRASSGKKEPTDIGVLANEYLRLSYHGVRGKDKSFNAALQTDFDETIGKINVIPQEIARVLLNLYTNAFYAISEKKKQIGEGYEPTLSVSTSKANGRAIIKVKDNGNGIPQKVADKIFQPFFTTKPAGKGTGLGLSLAYDIVKAHGGDLRVVTKEGEGSEFIIQLPIS